jgi:succinoglycan biosynthesis protein ExoA
MGPGRFHHATKREAVDTVYLGTFRASEFKELGGFRHLPSGSSEDADFYFRWRTSGRLVFVDPLIVSAYTPRDTPARLWAQYLRYGLGKAEMLWLNGRLPSLRPLAPISLIGGLVVTGIIGVQGTWWPFVALIGTWLVVLAWVGFTGRESVFRTTLAAGIMQLAYGLGAFWGLLRGPWRVRKALRAT